MENKEVYVTLGFDRAGNLVEYRRNGEVIPVGEAAALSVGTATAVPPAGPAQGGPQAGPAQGGPGSDPCLVRLPSGQLIRIC